MSWSVFVVLVILAVAAISGWSAGMVAVKDYIVEKRAYQRSKIRAFGVVLMSWLGLYLLKRSAKLHGPYRSLKHNKYPNVRILSTYKPKGR